MTNTENLNLKKPAQDDFYNVDDFSDNFQKIDEFAGRKDNPHNVTKEQLGLGNVDNTSDTNKPVSTAQKQAIDDAKSAGTTAQANLTNHTTDKENPHGVTKTQVGLGNVPNVATNDQTPTYTEASSLETLTSGEKMSVAFGKIKKAITALISHIADTTKHNHSTTSGAAIGKEATTGNGNGGAVGYKATTGGGGAVGDGATSNSGGGIGYLANAANGGAIGEEAKSNNGGAIGYRAKTANGCAIGHMAKTVNQDNVAIDAIQLGTGTNTTINSMQVYNYMLMNPDGTIPLERLSKRIVIGTYTGGGNYGVKNPNILNFESTPKLLIVTPVSNDSSAKKGGFMVLNGVTITRSGGLYDDVSGSDARLYFTWEKTVTWYSPDSADIQQNVSTQEYRYLAIL